MLPVDSVDRAHKALAAALADAESSEASRSVRHLYEQQANAGFDLESLLHEKTKSLRKRVWELWTQFAALSNFDPENLWVDFRRGQGQARNRCIVFLRYYVHLATAERPCLGDSETEEVRTVGCAVTLEDAWSALVQVANIRVMQPLREAEPEKADYWILKRNRGGGFIEPADAVAKWIPTLAQELGLSLEQTFEKKEMTSADVILILDTLWMRADAIPCSPQQRVDFHCAIMLIGIGGWRSASVLGIKYKDVELGWLRDPRDPSKTWPVSSNTIRHVKLKKNRIRRNQRHLLKFSMTMVDYAPLCLLRFLLCRAIADQAFKAGFSKLEDITQPKPLEDGIDYTPLDWSEKMLEKKIIDLKYRTFWEIWNRCLLVAGLYDKRRPHSMRVGSGGRLDGSLTDAVRNYILSNSTNVFEDSYQPVDLRVNLMKISFGAIAGDTDALITKRHQAFTERDPNAPIYITQGDLQQFNERDDIRSLKDERKQASLKGGSRCEEVKRINGQIAHIMNTLEEKRILERRQKYFQEVKQLRAKGLPTTHLQSGSSSNPRPKLYQKYSSRATAIGHCMFATSSATKAFDQLVAFLTGVSEDSDESKQRNGSRCFLCSRTFSNKSGLTRHVHQSHRETFDQPFDCPECHRQGIPGRRIENRTAWSAHTSKFHGARNTPNPQGVRTHQEVYCFLCSKAFKSSGFNLHLDRSHIKLGQFETAFACPVDGHVIANLDAWVEHCQDEPRGREGQGGRNKTLKLH